MKHLFRILLISSLLCSCTHKSSISTAEKDKPLTAYVNTFIRAGGHGHIYPGATMPFGMMQLSPDTRLEGCDGCSGYHYDDIKTISFKRPQSPIRYIKLKAKNLGSVPEWHLGHPYNGKAWILIDEIEIK